MIASRIAPFVLAASLFGSVAVMAERHYSAPAPSSQKWALLDDDFVGLAAGREVVLQPSAAGAIHSATPLVAAGGGAMLTGIVHEISPGQGISRWEAVSGGYALRWDVRVPGSPALRIAVDVRSAPPGTKLRFRRAGVAISPRDQYPARDGLHWSAVIAGESAVVEAFIPARAARTADLRLARVVEQFVNPLAPAAKSTWLAQQCQPDLICESRSDATLARAGTASVKLNWVKGHGAYSCSGTLLNPADGSYRPYIYTAAHCISEPEEAATLVTHWFFEKSACGGEDVRSDAVQVGGGAELLAVDTQIDASFLRLNSAPPAGVTFAGWDTEPPPAGQSVTAIHHANGEVTKVSRGTVMPPPPYPYTTVSWSSGIVQGGSSGSGLFTRAEERPDLLVRGALSGANASCSSPGTAVYSRLDRFWPQIAPYLSVRAESANATGLWWEPGRPGWGLSLSQQGEIAFGVLFAYDEHGTARWWVASEMHRGTAGDFSGVLYRATGQPLWSSRAAAPTVSVAGDLRMSLANAGEGEITYSLDEKTVRTVAIAKQVFGEHAAVCAPTQKSLASARNYQDMWWNPEEPGWGLAIAHQGDVLFANLFTYEESGTPTWYVGSEMRKVASGAYEGALYQTKAARLDSGTTSVEVSPAGRLRLEFADGETARAAISLGAHDITKRLTRQRFGEARACH